LESLHAQLIKQGISQRERLIILNENAIMQMRSLSGNPSVAMLEEKNKRTGGIEQ